MKKTGKEYTFFFHYNKPSGLITVHYRGRCYLTPSLRCNVATVSKFNKTQPKFVVKGKCSKFIWDKKGIVIA